MSEFHEVPKLLETMTDHPSSVLAEAPLDGGLPPLQRRWTIALRALLVFPNMVLLLLLMVAVIFVMIAAWLSALVIGRVPRALRRMIAYTVRWEFRFAAYTLLLTDRYPDFHGRATSDFPLVIELPEATKLRRSAVFFRFILVLPVNYLSVFIGLGLYALAFPLWVAALILGRLPNPIYRAGCVYLRFSTRVTAYGYLLTPEYPWGFRGDEATASTPAPVVDTYWDRLAAASAQRTTLRDAFDFRLAGWATAWLWIFLVVGGLLSVRARF